MKISETYRKPGLDKLRKAVERDGVRAVAASLGKSPAFVHMMLSGKRHVSLFVAMKLGAVLVKSK